VQTSYIQQNHHPRRKNTEYMPLRRRSEGKAHKLDIKGIAVAIAFLVTVSLFAGGRDAHTAGQNRQSSSISMQTDPTTSTEKTDSIQRTQPHLPDSPRSLNTLR
jgi:hypothetical protein